MTGKGGAEPIPRVQRLARLRRAFGCRLTPAGRNGGPARSCAAASCRPAQRSTVAGPDPAAFLLVCYRREPQWKHIATGRMLAWGRRPWLAPTLVSRFHAP
jgi:hypothetical protein